jgi:hypothetical protein
MNFVMASELECKYGLTGDNFRPAGIYEEWKKGNEDRETVWDYYRHKIEVLNALNDRFQSLKGKENIKMVQNILDELEDSTQSEVQKYMGGETPQDSPLIFLSHRSSDKRYGNALRNFIYGLGVKNEQLIYTSHPLHNIPTGKDIYDFLREKLTKSVYVIFLLSNEYFDSAACLNEMGAAWLAQKDYTNIFTPDFNFRNKKFLECVIDKNKMGVILNSDETCKSRMIEFKNNILKLFNLQIDEQSWTVLLDDFMKTINSKDK